MAAGARPPRVQDGIPRGLFFCRPPQHRKPDPGPTPRVPSDLSDPKLNRPKETSVISEIVVEPGAPIHDTWYMVIKAHTNQDTDTAVGWDRAQGQVEPLVESRWSWDLLRRDTDENLPAVPDRRASVLVEPHTQQENTMPFISTWEAPAVFHIVTIDEDGVRVEANEDSVDVYIYRAYKNESPSTFWFNADPDEYEGTCGPYDFDIRQLAKSLGFPQPETDDDMRMVLDRAVVTVMEGKHWADVQSSRCIAHAIFRAGESAANAVPTRS